MNVTGDGGSRSDSKVEAMESRIRRRGVGVVMVNLGPATKEMHAAKFILFLLTTALLPPVTRTRMSCSTTATADARRERLRVSLDQGHKWSGQSLATV